MGRTVQDTRGQAKNREFHPKPIGLTFKQAKVCLLVPDSPWVRVPVAVLLGRGKLSAGEFGPVAGPEVLDSGSEVPGKQVLHSNIQNSGEDEQLQVRNSTALILQAGDRLAAGVPPEELQFDGKVRLRPSLAQSPLAHLRANDVQVRGAVFDAATVAAAAF